MIVKARAPNNLLWELASQGHSANVIARRCGVSAELLWKSLREDQELETLVRANGKIAQHNAPKKAKGKL